MGKFNYTNSKQYTQSSSNNSITGQNHITNGDTKIDGGKICVNTTSVLGSMAGGFAGVKLGAAIGAIDGPVGALVGGVIGGGVGDKIGAFFGSLF